MLSPARLPRRTSFFFVLALLAGSILLLPWWRNHGILRDFYDYGNVMAAAGRIQLGDRPYVDFLSPIQTLQFYQAVLAERIFGARYFSLTYAAALFTVGTFAVFITLLIRPLGWTVALLVSAAVVAGTSAQHTIVWYNAMGVAWLAMVVWILAGTNTRGKPGRTLLMVVFGALWLGGMTKLTYQTAALSFFVLFTLSAVQREVLPWRTALWWLAGGALSGVVLPVVTELVLTGARWSEWTDNVFRLAQSRAELLKAIATTRFYLHTPHDYYRPMMFGAVGLWGMVLLSWVGIMAIWARRKTADGHMSGLLVFLAALAGSVCCGLVFLATHLEIAYFAGAGFLLFATGLVIAFVPTTAVLPSRWARIGLGCGALTLAVPAWISAWSGARAVWGREKLVRSDLVSTNDLPASFDYLKPLRVLPSIHDAMVNVAKLRDSLNAKHVPESSYYFTQGTEWLVRVMPEGRHAQLPLWTQFGTTYNADDLPQFIARLASGAEIQTVIVESAWETWPPRLKQALDFRYQRESLGDFGVYRLNPGWSSDCLQHPVLFSQATHSNFYSAGLTATSGSVYLNQREKGAFLGSDASFQLRTNYAVQDWSGEMCAELSSKAGDTASVEVVFKVREFVGAKNGRIVAEEKVRLTALEPVFRRSFSVSSPASRFTLEVKLPPDRSVTGGWSRLVMKRSTGSAAGVPWPLDSTSQQHMANENWRHALFAERSDAIGELVGFGPDVHADQRNGVPELFCHAPGEVWLQITRPLHRIRGEFGLREGAWQNANALLGVRMMVIYYHAGRFEVLYERELHTKTNEGDRAPQSFEVAVPESAGWIGLVILPLDPNSNAWGHSWLRNVRVE